VVPTFRDCRSCGGPAWVAAGRMHYFVAGGGIGGRGPGGGDSGIAAWVTANFTAVSVGGQYVYDLTQPAATI
jgi:hypothetical protein